MTLYHVHLYREMRLSFRGVEADSPEAAAAIARDKPKEEADDFDDCDGEEFAALVDVAGDEEYRQSVVVDFAPERVRKAASAMLAAIEAFIEADELAERCAEWKWENLESAFAQARAARALARTAEIPPVASRFAFTHHPAEDASRAYVLVDNRFDVALNRTDEGLIVDVYPKEGSELLGTLCLWDDQAAAPEAQA